ncbi:MAG: hypothetical protein EXS35_11890 [Pedosphaera sp.]|nr:hypothetical protein [Pedosphaera sp.]
MSANQLQQVNPVRNCANTVECVRLVLCRESAEPISSSRLGFQMISSLHSQPFNAIMKRFMFRLLLVLCTAMTVIPVSAADKWWKGGAGTLDNTTANFYAVDATGGTLVTAATTDRAIFSAGGTFTSTYSMAGTATYTGLTVEEGNIALTGTITIGAGSVTIGSGTTLSINSSFRLSATAGSVITINGGTMEDSNAGASGSFVDTDQTIVLGTGGGTLSHTVAAVLNIISGSTIISGTGPLTKTGAGILAVATASTYSGSTTVNNGTLRCRTINNPFPTGTDLIVTSPGIFDCSTLKQTVNSLTGNGSVTATTSSSGILTVNGTTTPAAFTGVMSGSGTLAHTGSGTLTLGGVNTYSGKFTNTTGVVTVNAGGALCGAVCDVTVSGGTVNLNNTAQTIEDLNGTGGTINLGTGHTLTSEPVLSTTCSSTIAGPGGLTRLNANATTRTLTLSGPNTYDGVTTVTKGIISVGSATALGTSAGNTSVASGAEILFTGAGVTFTCAEPFSIAGAGGADAGAIAIIASATPTLSGTVTLTADATITISSSASGTFSAATSFSGTSQTLTLAGGANASGTKAVTGVIALGTGGVTKTQGGTWDLSGVNTYTGATLVSAGRLNVNSPGSLAAGSTVTVATGATLGGTGTVGGPTTIQSGGTLAPGTSIGTLTFSSSLALSGTTSMEIDKTAATADKIVMSSGTVTLGGNLTVANLAGTLAAGDSFDLIDGTIAGGFTAITLPSLASGLAWNLANLTVDGTISVQTITAPTIATQPANQTACAGSTATFSVAAGSGLCSTNYTWSKTNNAGWSSAWATSTASGGTSFRGSSTDNNFGDPACTTFTSANDINSPSGVALGIYGGTSGDMVATRTFTALTAGQVVSIDIDNGNVETGKKVGFSLQTSGGTDLLQFYFLGGATFYKYNDGTEKDTTVGFQRTGVRVQFVLGLGNTYTLIVTPCGGATTTYTGSFAAGSIAKLKLFNQNVTGGSDHNFYFNNFLVGGYVDNAGNGTGNFATQDTGDQPIVSGNGGSTYTTPTLTIGDSGTKYQVVVSTCGGALLSSSATLTVNARPTSVASGSATLCGGDSTTIQAALTGTGPWNVAWSDGITQTGVASSPASRSVSPSSSFTYTVTNLTDANCTAQAGDRTGSAVITVNTIVANTATYTRGASAAIKINIANLLTNASDTLLQTISLLGIGTDGANLTSTNGATLSTNLTLINYPGGATPNVTDSFKYKVTDTQGCVTLGTVIINVAPVSGTNTITSLQVNVPGANTNTLIFAGIPGYEYVTEFSTNLTDWEAISTNTASGLGQWTVIDDTATNAMRFYRSLAR